MAMLGSRCCLVRQFSSSSDRLGPRVQVCLAVLGARTRKLRSNVARLLVRTGQQTIPSPMVGSQTHPHLLHASLPQVRADALADEWERAGSGPSRRGDLGPTRLHYMYHRELREPILYRQEVPWLQSASCALVTSSPNPTLIYPTPARVPVHTC